MSREEIKKLFIAGAVFAGALAYLIGRDIITTAQAIEPTILFVLVLVTVTYAKRTAEIAKETREQRYSESLPLLAPVITTSIAGKKLERNEIDYQLLQAGIGIKVMWQNVGKGVAINLRFSLWGAPLPSGRVPFFPPLESQALEVGGQKEIDFGQREQQWLDRPERYQPQLEAEYQDIYERKIATVQEFRIDEQAERAFLGELYFTINGQRLGGEITQHD